MKKNISINIFGTIYAIDEDAYQLLENYLESMKSYFQRQEGGEEIADDIEHRVAELLWERKEQGMEAVNIETVKEIIGKIGRADDIDDEVHPEENSESEDPAAETAADAAPENGDAAGEKAGNADTDTDFFTRLRHRVRHKRLYRNVEDKMIGGVCSGLAEYFEVGDVTVWRLLTVILTIVFASIHFMPRCISFCIPMLYVLLLIITPRAVTPEDKLRMKGREVNPQTLKDQIVSESEDLAREKAATAHRGGSNLSGCLHIIAMLFLAALLFPLGILLVFSIVSFIALALTSIIGFGTFTGIADPLLMSFLHESSPFILCSLLAGVAVGALPFWAIISRIRSSERKTSPARFIVWLVVWFIALGIGITCCVLSAMKFQELRQEQQHIDCTRNGITLGNMQQWQRMDENGWKISRMQNIQPYIIDRNDNLGSLPENFLTIRRFDASKPISLAMNRIEYHGEGYYKLQAITQNGGSGLSISIAKADKPDEILATVLPENPGINLEDKSWKDAVAMDIISSSDSTAWDEYSNKEKMRLQTSETFYHPGGNLNLSIRAEKAFLNSCNIRMLGLKPAEAPSTVKDKKRK